MAIFQFPTSEDPPSDLSELTVNKFWFLDDFIGSIDDIWTINTVGANSQVIKAQGKTGYVSIISGNVIGNTAELTTSNLDIVLDTGPTIEARVYFIFFYQFVKFEIGLINGAAHYLIFRYDPSVSPNWFAVAKDGAGETSTDTGIPVISTGFIKLRIKGSLYTSYFYINDSLVATLTTNLTTSNLNFSAKSTAQSVNLENVFLDYVLLKGTRLST